jgi:hypothetical protein
MDWSKLLESLKLGVRVWSALFIALTVLAFGPKNFLSRLGLNPLLIGYRGWIGVGAGRRRFGIALCHGRWSDSEAPTTLAFQGSASRPQQTSPPYS